MKLITILVAVSALFSSAVLAYPVEAKSAAAAGSIHEARKCAYSGCSTCHAYCYNGKHYV
jgi:cytochrome c553